MESPQPLVTTAPEWTLAHFQSLLRKDILALRIPLFVDERTRQHWKNSLKDHSRFSRYANAPEVKVSTLGMTLFETQNETKRLERYFQEAERFDEDMERVFAPRISPFEKIRRRLVRIWPVGVCGGTLQGRAMCPGIIRKFEEANSDGLPPHQDMLHKDVPAASEARDMKSQIAVNLYIQVPDNGGELEVWNTCLSDEERAARSTGEHDFIDRAGLPEPERLRPRNGELILFHSDQVHAVRGMERAERIAASCFLGYYGPDRPLRYWA